MLGRLWAALGLTGVYSGCAMIEEPPLLVSAPREQLFPDSRPTLNGQRLISDCVSDPNP